MDIGQKWLRSTPLLMTAGEVGQSGNRGKQVGEGKTEINGEKEAFQANHEISGLAQN